MAKKVCAMEEAARRLKVTPRTLHYYEEIGLLEGVTRTGGGHRQYDEATLRRVEHILRLKDLLGFSLQEIRTILDAEKKLDNLRSSYYQEPSVQQRAAYLHDAAEQLGQVIEQIDKKIENLKTMRQSFEQRLSKTRDLLQAFDVSQSDGEEEQPR